jgi:hypothetical protein
MALPRGVSGPSLTTGAISAFGASSGGGALPPLALPPPCVTSAAPRRTPLSDTGATARLPAPGGAAAGIDPRCCGCRQS